MPLKGTSFTVLFLSDQPSFCSAGGRQATVVRGELDISDRNIPYGSFFGRKIKFADSKCRKKVHSGGQARQKHTVWYETGFRGLGRMPDPDRRVWRPGAILRNEANPEPGCEGRIRVPRERLRISAANSPVRFRQRIEPFEQAAHRGGHREVPRQSSAWRPPLVMSERARCG